MLQFQLLKNHAGLCIAGPQTTLRALYEAVHAVNDKSPIVRDREGFFAALAYDVRTAIEGNGRVFPAVEGAEDKLFGFNILWPVLLLQTRMLRDSLSWFDSTKTQQSATFTLEAAVEAGLDADFENQAPQIRAAYLRLDPAHEWPETKIHSRGAQYSMWNAKQRREGLLNVLESLDPMYPAIYGFRFKAGERGLLAPLALDSLESADWVDPKW